MNPNEVTLKQGTNYYNNQTGKLEGTVQYDAKTGQKLAAGQTTTQAMPSNVITSSSLIKNPPLTLPTTANSNPTATNALMGNINNVVTTSMANQATTKTNASDKYAALTDLLSTKGTKEADLNKQYQIEEKAKLKNSLEAQILEADQANKKAVDALYAKGGATREQVQPQVTENQRLYASQAADRAIAYHIANQDYTTAVDTVEKKVNAEFQGYKDQLDALNTFITQNKQLSDADRMLLQDKYQKGILDYQSKIDLANYNEKAKIDASAGFDPNNIPYSSNPTSYTVKPSDGGGLYAIAQANGIDFEALKSANPQLDINFTVKPGDVLNLPPKGVAQVDLNSLQRNLIASKGLSKQQRSDIINLVQTDGVDGVKSWAYENKLSQGQKSDFDTYASGQSAYESALGQIGANNISAGPYKALLEISKPFLGITKDKNYSDLKAIIEQGQAQIRKGYFGTAVTGSEASSARNFLISDNDDINTIQWKLENGKNFLKFVNDAQINRSIGIPRPNINEYIIPKDTVLLNNWLSGSSISSQGSGNLETLWSNNN